MMSERLVEKLRRRGGACTRACVRPDSTAPPVEPQQQQQLRPDFLHPAAKIGVAQKFLIGLFS